MIQLIAGVLLLANVADGATCQSDDSLKDLVQTVRRIPTTIENPSPRISLCSAPPVVTLDATLSNPVVGLSIPLSSIDTRPMTARQFQAAISGVSIPAPWASGPAKWSIQGKGRGAKLVLSAPSESPGAWMQAPAFVHLTLRSGQNVDIRVSSPEIIRDSTANLREGLRRDIRMKEEDLSRQRDLLSRTEGWIKDPATIPFASQQVLDAALARLATDGAAADSMRLALSAAWSKASLQDKASALWFLAGRDAGYGPLSEQATADVNALASARKDAAAAQEMLDTLSRLDPPPSELVDEEKAKLTAALAAAEGAQAALQGVVAQVEAKADKDALLAAAQPVLDPAHPDGFANLLRGIANDTATVSSLTSLEQEQRAASLEKATASVPEIKATVSADRKTIEEDRERLSGHETQTARGATEYPSGCPGS